MYERIFRESKIFNLEIVWFGFRSIYIVTWNVSTKYPEGIALNNLLGLENNPENDLQRPDFYVIG